MIRLHIVLYQTTSYFVRYDILLGLHQSFTNLSERKLIVTEMFKNSFTPTLPNNCPQILNKYIYFEMSDNRTYHIKKLDKMNQQNSLYLGYKKHFLALVLKSVGLFLDLSYLSVVTSIYKQLSRRQLSLVKQAFNLNIKVKTGKLQCTYKCKLRWRMQYFGLQGQQNQILRLLLKLIFLVENRS